MTGIPAYLLAHWWLFASVLAFVGLIVGVPWAVSWYFWRRVIEIEQDAKILECNPIAYGDSTHLSDGYWDAVARKEAKERAG